MTTLQERPVEASATARPAGKAPDPSVPAEVLHLLEPEIPRAIGNKTMDERLAYWGSLISGGLLTWLLYFQLLPFTGAFGFVIVWYVVFLALYALVSAESNPRPIVIDRVMGAVVSAAAMLIFGMLAYVVVYVSIKGWPALHHLNFFTQDSSGVRPTSGYNQGGIRHAYLGSLIEVGIASGIALPLGIGTAVYMSEVGGRFSKIVRTVIEAMTALPDILAGLFIYNVWIITFGNGLSGIAAAFALAITMTPIIARSSDVTLRLISGGLKEASLALGASQWRTVWNVVLPTARSGLATALILGIARAVGETAPVLIVSGANTYQNLNPLHGPMNSLPLYIYSAFASGEPTQVGRAYAAAIVLLALVVILFALTRFIARDKKKGSR